MKWEINLWEILIEESVFNFFEIWLHLFLYLWFPIQNTASSQVRNQNSNLNCDKPKRHVVYLATLLYSRILSLTRCWSLYHMRRAPGDASAADFSCSAPSTEELYIFKAESQNDFSTVSAERRPCDMAAYLARGAKWGR